MMGSAVSSDTLLPSLMKAVVSYDSDKPLVLEERATPVPGAGEVLVKVERCGVCGSDLRTRKAARRLYPSGLVMGHEYAGRIVNIGRGVDPMRIGDRVAAYPGAGCGDCPACRNHHHVLCARGHHVMGGFAEYAVVPAHCAITLPGDVDTAAGALIEPLAVGCHAVRRAELKPGEPVLVVGAGTIALAAVYWARRAGAGHISVVSRSPRRAPMALRMGADSVLPIDEVTAATAGTGEAPAAIFECTGATAMLQAAIDWCAPFGRVLALGSSPVPETFVPASAGRKAITLQFPIGYTLEDFVRTAGSLRTTAVDARELVSDVVPLESLPTMFEALLEPNLHNKVQAAL